MNERRSSDRFEPISQIPARIGRREGVILNVSRHGVRVRHPGTLKVNEIIDVAFPCSGGLFAARARVLSCRATPMRDAEGALVFESSCAFATPSAEAVAMLERFLRS